MSNINVEHTRTYTHTKHIYLRALCLIRGPQPMFRIHARKEQIKLKMAHGDKEQHSTGQDTCTHIDALVDVDQFGCMLLLTKAISVRL